MDALVARKRAAERRSEAVAVPAAAAATDDGSLVDEIADSCRAMTRHAFATGIPVPAWVVDVVDGVTSSATSKDLVRAHVLLARLVHPAVPRTLVLLDRERHRPSILRALGPVKLVRQLMVASAFFLATFVGTSLSPLVDVGSGDLFTSSGLNLLVNEAFLLSAAGIGASFAALFQVNRYIAKGTYDPKFDTSYWTRFILGLIAGMVLAELIPVEGSFSRPLLALVGGFSASVVYRILTRIVETLESFVSGEAPPGSRVDVPVADATAAAERLRLAHALLSLRNDASGASLYDKLDSVVAGLIHPDPAAASPGLGVDPPEAQADP